MKKMRKFFMIVIIVAFVYLFWSAIETVVQTLNSEYMKGWDKFSITMRAILSLAFDGAMLCACWLLVRIFEEKKYEVFPADMKQPQYRPQQPYGMPQQNIPYPGAQPYQNMQQPQNMTPQGAPVPQPGVFQQPQNPQGPYQQ